MYLCLKVYQIYSLQYLINTNFNTLRHDWIDLPFSVDPRACHGAATRFISYLIKSVNFLIFISMQLHAGMNYRFPVGFGGG